MWFPGGCWAPWCSGPGRARDGDAEVGPWEGTEGPGVPMSALWVPGAGRAGLAMPGAVWKAWCSDCGGSGWMRYPMGLAMAAPSWAVLCVLHPKSMPRLAEK